MKGLLLVLMAFGIAFAGLSVDAYTVTKDSFRPGEPGVVTVTVSNPTGAERVTSITMSIDRPTELVVTSAPKMADIDAGGSAIVSIPFRVKDDAKPGIYLMNVVFTGYKSAEGTGYAATSTNIVSVPITVVNEPILVFTTDKQVIGGLDDILVTIANNGGKASNVRISTPSDADVSLYGTDEIFISSITDEEQTDLMLDSRDAPDGPTDVAFNVEYEDELGMSHTEDMTLRMTVRNERLDLTFIQNSDVITKKESTMSLSVRNDGTEPLEDVRLAFADSVLRIKGSGELKFGDLAPGQTATASATVFAELPPGVNLVDGQLSWIEKDVQKEGTRQVPITITSDSEVGVYLEAKPLPLTLGSDHTISVLVSNLGSYSIENVDVKIESPALRSEDISDTQYIGGLQNDDFSTVQFQMGVNATEAGTYPIKITVNYRDQSGEWKTQVINQSISVYGAAASQDSPLPLLFGIGVIAVAVWYFKFRKAKA